MLYVYKQGEKYTTRF